MKSMGCLNPYRSTYRSFCRWAFETGRVTANPASRLRSARVDSPPTALITPEETRRFLAAIRCSNDPLRLRDETEQTQRAEAGREEWKSGGERCGGRTIANPLAGYD